MQYRDRENTMKDFRYLFHLILALELIWAFDNMLEVFVFSGDLPAFNYSLWISMLVLRKVNNPTNNLKILHITAHAITVLVSICALLGIYYSFGFGLSVKLFIKQWSLYMIFQITYVVLRFFLVLVFSLAQKDYDQLVDQPGYLIIRLLVMFMQQLSISSLIVVLAISPERLKKFRFCWHTKRESEFSTEATQGIITNRDTRKFTKNPYQLEDIKEDLEDDVTQGGDALTSTETKVNFNKMMNRQTQKKIDRYWTDEEFKAKYSPSVLKKQTTLVLKTSFHLINIILMGMCAVFKQRTNPRRTSSGVTNKTQKKNEKNTSVKSFDNIKHQIDLIDFMNAFNDYLIYDIGPTNNTIEIIEFAPATFSAIRQKFGISDDLLFNSFIPIHNIQAIHNFFTGAGKSSSFFFFADNKSFVLKTLKESEKRLLLETNLLENYYEHILQNPNTILSRYYGVYQIRVGNMAEINCFIMDNLLGQDFFNIERIFDLKGSTRGRIVNLSENEIKTGSGLKVLKDLNFINLGEKLQVPEHKRNEILNILEKDSLFLSQNNLMDYSLLFIKAKNVDAKKSSEMQKMPAIVYVKQKNGENQLQLRETDELEIQNVPFKTVPYIPGMTETNSFSPQINSQGKKKAKRTSKSIQIMPEMSKSKSQIVYKQDLKFTTDIQTNVADRTNNVDDIQEFLNEREHYNNQGFRLESGLSVYSRKDQNKESIIHEADKYVIESCFNEYKFDAGVYLSLDKEYRYKLGVIDFLTDYNTAKKLETTWNTIKHWNNAHETSCQQPEIYSQRFIRFLNEVL
ncbi:1-phosphatidylinositol-4-phosphate 5-kinase [Stylonychia lemnae]|uniref:1-phosphatidylinositol-4-phosphate 5-kinase n=1 Tax=Stylonychia lemnae TaxID=5949 RepID=A0A078APQ7_STYLE|nr:1-phosphatidylinositol-4-phosphate 5-kinase [Stylonychia lemnae]|eukprot:CDW82893.1 1-phosphatidylinositol-4-phosphate 5-kinase [Stylonychia lemnae]